MRSSATGSAPAQAIGDPMPGENGSHSETSSNVGSDPAAEDGDAGGRSAHARGTREGGASRFTQSVSVSTRGDAPQPKTGVGAPKHGVGTPASAGEPKRRRDVLPSSTQTGPEGSLGGATGRAVFAIAGGGGSRGE